MAEGEKVHICIFEDNQFRMLHPLVYLKPVYDLTCGIATLREKILRNFPQASVTLHVRNYLAEVLKRDNPGYLVNELPSDPGEVLFINGRVLAGSGLGKDLEFDGTDCVFTSGDTPVAAWLSGENLETFGLNLPGKIFSMSDFSGLNKKKIGIPLITYPWELVNNNGAQIAADFNYAVDGNPQIQGELSEGVHLLNSSQIHISGGTMIKPGVVLDAENGPIYIGNNSKVLPNAVIEGPVSIGENCLIKVGAKIYENSSIGKVCKVGGELEESIIDAYSNKQHDGFIGHAYIGSWVNIGADTNNSDLKNNYGTVTVFLNGKAVDSGSMFVGLFMGAHSKTGINLMFNTGTVVGVCCNIYGSGLPPKFVPSFTWGGGDFGFTTYRIHKALEVAGKVMARRNVQFTQADEKLFRTVFDLTAEERMAADIKD